MPETVIETCNEPDDTLLFRLEDGVGHHAQRMIGGVRDSWITDNKILAALALSFDGPLTIGGTYNVPAPLSALQVLTNFMAGLQQFTMLEQPVDVIPKVWNNYPNNNVIFRYTANRKRGRPFGQSRGRAANRV